MSFTNSIVAGLLYRIKREAPLGLCQGGMADTFVDEYKNKNKSAGEFMKNRVSTIALLAILHSIPSFAAPIADTVTIGEREWAQPDLFLGSSWEDIRAACDPTTGVCSGSINGWDMSGWTWASNSVVVDLMNVYVQRDGGSGNELLDGSSDLYRFKPGSTVWRLFFSETGLRPTLEYSYYYCASVCGYGPGSSFQLLGWTSTSQVLGPRVGALTGLETESSIFDNTPRSSVWTTMLDTNEHTSYSYGGDEWPAGYSEGFEGHPPPGFGGWFYRPAAAAIQIPTMNLPALVFLAGVLGWFGIRRLRTV